MIQALAVIIVIFGLVAVAATLLASRADTSRVVTVAASIAVGLQVVVILLAAFGVGAPSDSTPDTASPDETPAATAAP